MLNKLLAKTPIEIASKITDIQPLTGGSTSQTYWLSTDHGTGYVMKYINSAYKNIFECEQKGLEALHATGLFKIPQVFIRDADYILMEYIKGHQPDQKDWNLMGEKVAQLHTTHQSRYGLNYDNYLGTIPQHNHWQDDWINFFIEQRLRPLLQLPIFTIEDLAAFDRLFQKLSGLLCFTPQASFLHGDLWQNNMVFSGNDIYCIDPAIYYGPREMDLAYLEFIGGEATAMLKAYHYNYPLQPEYQEQKEIYMLYSLLIHIHLGYPGEYLSRMRTTLNYFS